MENFVQLHCHSCFSVYDAISTPEQLVDKAVEHGHSALALTDHGVMGGLYRLQKAALSKGIKPLLGMEGYVVNDLISMNEQGKKRIRTPNNHIILIAKNETGWKNLLRLNYLSNSDDDHFYYKPRFTFDELFEHKEGLICSTACLAAPMARLLLDGKEDEAALMFQRYVDNFGDNLMAEIQLNEIEGQHIYDNWLIEQANKHGIPIVITGDVHYAEKDGSLTQKLAFAIRNESENEVGQEFAAKSLYYHGIDDYKDFNKRFGYNFTDEQIEEWCGNTKLVESKVDFLIPERTKMHLPRQAFDENQTLIDKAKEGLAKHFNCKYEECPKEYVDRLEYELKLMWKKGIARYILCLSDICNWCDGEGHVSRGVGRGSACGSLVLACVGITGWAIDPIKNGLLFERFVSESRLPDVMIDYSKSGNNGI